jgi:hypothetical protein
MAGDLAADVADRPAEPGAQRLQLPTMALVASPFDGYHFSSESLASSAASRTVRLESSSMSVNKSAMSRI